MGSFLDTLAERPLLFDGAIGSWLYDHGVLHTACYDELNVSRPALLRDIHHQYRGAGADILETNTFGANRISLARHGYADRTVDINRAGVALARECADGAFVAGAVGPTGVRFAVATTAERAEVRGAFEEQITALTEAGVDLLVFETFASITELETALDAARTVAPSVARVAQMMFDADGTVDGGLSPDVVAERLVAAGADVVGVNCGHGPPELYPVGAQMVAAGVPVSIQPNAGHPALVDGRTLYVANPEHFGVFARRLLKSGVRLIGGCCGTTPEHVRAMQGAVRMMRGERIGANLPADVVASGPPAALVPLAERSKLGAAIAEGRFAVSMELGAPSGTDTGAAVDRGVRRAMAGGVEIVNVADGPRAQSRMSNVAFCAEAITATGVEPIVHVCCRDRNYLGLIAHLLGAHALGVRDLVIITGDPPKMGEYAFATPVYDVDSIGLLEIAAGLNAGMDPTGKTLEGGTSFVLATGAEPGAVDRDRELERLARKKAAGAELVMTQPVYDPETLESFLIDAADIGLPVMVGLLPLASARNAEFLHHEVPGMQIPQHHRDRMAAAGNGPEARLEGIAIAREALAAVKDRVAGAYIMPPFNRVESALAIFYEVRGTLVVAGMSDVRAFVAGSGPDGYSRRVEQWSADAFGNEAVDIRVEWSCINFKDGLATSENGKVARLDPLVPGVDLAGTVVASRDAGVAVGQQVIVHGYDLGVAHHGGYAELARVPAEWIVPMPDGLDTRTAMLFGTAGYTAALSVEALERQGLQPGDGPVLVTGATGGVGSMAVGMLAARGYEVVASTGKIDEGDWLRGLGASDVIDRRDLTPEQPRPLDKERWAGAVDCVGGPTLAHVLRTMRSGGSVAASGLTGGAGLPTTVHPFILRGVNLLGIESVLTPIEPRRRVWGRIATDLRPAWLSTLDAEVVGLDDLPAELDPILAGGMRGRVLVDPTH